MAICEITGILYKQDETPFIDAVLTVYRCVKDGVPVVKGPVRYRLDDAEGNFDPPLILPRDCTAYIYANAEGFDGNPATGSPVAIPDAATAELSTLQAELSFPTQIPVAIPGGAGTPGGTGTQIQARLDASTFAGISGSSFDGSTVTFTTLVAALRDKGGAVYNAKNYLVADGVTDDSAALASLIATVAAAGGGVILFPPATYAFASGATVGNGTSTTVSTYSGVSLVGMGSTQIWSTAAALQPAVKFKAITGLSGTMLTVAGPIGGVKVEGITLDCNGIAANGMKVMHGEGTVIRNVHIRNFTGVGFEVDSHNTASFNSGTIFTGNYGNTGRVEGLFINTSSNNTIGVRLGATGTVSQWTFSGGRWRLDGTTGSIVLQLRYADNNYFYGVAGKAEKGVEVRPIAGQPAFPANNFRWGCAFLATDPANGYVVNTTDSAWTPSPQGEPILGLVTEGADIPSNSNFYGFTDKKEFFGGAWTFITSPKLDDLTAGSLLFVGSDKSISQDNANLFYDNSTDSLGLGANSFDTGYRATISIASTQGLRVNNSNGTTGGGLHLGRTNAPTSGQSIGFVAFGAAAALTDTQTNSAIIQATASENHAFNTARGTTLQFGLTPIGSGTAGRVVAFTFGNDYLNFGSTFGSTGFGFRLNGSSLEWKDPSGSWTAFSAGGGGTTLPVADTQTLVKGSADATKLLRVEVDGITTGTTRVWTAPDSDTTIPIISQVLTFTGPTAARTYTLPDANSTLATLAGSESLSNKTLVTPTIASFANANHDHSNSAGGGSLGNGVVTNAMLAGSIAISKLSITGTPDGTKFLRDDGSWAAAGGGGGADTALSNLASVAINTALLPGTDNSIALGSTSKRWSNLFVAGSLIVGTNATAVSKISAGSSLGNKIGIYDDGSAFYGFGIQANSFQLILPSSSPDFNFGTGDSGSFTAIATLTGGGQFSAKSVRGVAVAFASLPASPVEGMLVAVTDSSTATWGATITGGGSNHVLAYYNGTNWTVAGK